MKAGDGGIINEKKRHKTWPATLLMCAAPPMVSLSRRTAGCCTRSPRLHHNKHTSDEKDTTYLLVRTETRGGGGGWRNVKTPDKTPPHIQDITAPKNTAKKKSIVHVSGVRWPFISLPSPYRGVAGDSKRLSGD